MSGYQIFTQPSQQALDTAANVLSGATLTFSLTGTSTPTDAYSDSALTIPVANPLSANSAGVFIPIFLNPSVSYRVVMKTQAGAVLQTWDPANENIINYFTRAVLGLILYGATPTPVDSGYPPGDVRRYVSGAAEQNRAWYCYGHTATYFSATQFFIAGDVTSIYKPITRVLVLGNAGVTGNLLVTSSAFAAGFTNVFLVDDSVSPLPNPILAVSVQVVSDARGPAVSTYDANYFNGGQIIANLNTGGNAVARTTITTRDAAGVSNCAAVLVAVPPTYTHDAGSGAGVFLTGGFSTQVGLAAPYAVLYSQVGCSLDIGTADTSRIGIPHNGTAIVIKTDLTVNAGNGATNRTNLTVNGLVDARIALNSNSAEKAAFYSSATETLMGSTANIDTTITQNGNRVLTFRGGNTTGASTPTVTANKPGSNAGIIEWVAVKTSAGTIGWQPIWGN